MFVDDKHLGSVDDVRRMHEAGELSKALEACEMAPPSVSGKVIVLEACSGCGGVRFVPCEECSGSCKVFLEELERRRRWRQGRPDRAAAASATGSGGGGVWGDRSGRGGGGRCCGRVELRGTGVVAGPAGSKPLHVSPNTELGG